MYGFGGSVWQNFNGNRNCPYLNRNGSKRNLNLNWIDNDFNEICRFAAVRNSLRSPSGLSWGSFVLELLAPATEHLANFCQRFRYLNIFLIVEKLKFPSHL